MIQLTEKIDCACKRLAVETLPVQVVVELADGTIAVSALSQAEVGFDIALAIHLGLPLLKLQIGIKVQTSDSSSWGGGGDVQSDSKSSRIDCKYWVTDACMHPRRDRV